VLKDLLHSLRALRKRPGFTALTILIIALGIGVNTAIFTIVNSVLWKPYPYTDAAQLVHFNEDSPSGALNCSAPNSEDWKARSNVLEDVSLYRFFPALTLRFPQQDRPAIVAYAHPNLFTILRVQPAMGRLFLADEDKPGAAPVALITTAAWEQYFGKDASIIGRTIRIDNGFTDSLTITGVLPPGFGYETVEFWLPLGRYPMAPDTMRANHWFAGVGRLRPGLTIPRARAELLSISTELEKEHPNTNKGVRVVIQSLSDYYAGRAKAPLLLLFWAVGFVMLIACGNVVHLVLTRTLSRGREMAVRLALGASSTQLVRLLLSEGLLLSLAGGAIGVLSAQWMVTAAIAAQPGLLPRMRKIDLDAEAVLYALAVTLFTALLLAVVPMWRVVRTSVLDSLQSAGRGTGDRRRQRLGWLMIAGEIAMASVLLAGAGLTIQGLRNLARVDVGYDPNGLLSVSFVPPAGKKYTEEAAAALNDRVQDAARSVPGYVSSALAAPFGVGGNGMLGPVVIPGRTNPSTPPLVPATHVTPDFFETMHIPIRQGRGAARIQGAIPEAVVNEEFVKRFLPGENPLGRRISVWSPAQIVGVVADTRLQGDLTAIKPEVYLPGVDAGGGPTLLVRLHGAPETASATLRERLQAAEPGMRVNAVRTMTSREAARTVVERFTRGLLLVFALLATVLACLGIYGVASYSVSQRTREIGIRMALGASRSNVARLIFGHTLAATILGAVIGLLGAAALSRLLQSQLYQVSPWDPSVLGGVLLTLILIAIVASVVPIQRASRVDPAISLRQE
jgi:putative ABC transport system permease protein